MTGTAEPPSSDESAPGPSDESGRGTAGPAPAEPQLSTAERAVELTDRALPYLCLLPALLLVAALVVYPAVRAVELSLFQVQLLDLAARRWVGVANYRTLAADPEFGRVVRNTVVFVGASVLGQVGIGLGLALLLDRPWLAGTPARLARVLLVLPWATTGVIVAFSWRFVFHGQVGLANTLLRAVGIGDPPSWLHSVEWAMVAVVVANVWRGVPFSLIFQTSGLQSISARLTEAAASGGASSRQTLRYVTLPLIRPFVAMNLLLVALFTLNVFDVIYVMTGGGPVHATEVLSLHMYEVAFEEGAFGRANAVAVVLFGCNLAIVALYLTAFDRPTGGVR